MTRRTVLTAIGHDRPGLVEEVSEFLFERGGSIEESRMANLRGQFAIAMLVAGSGDAIDAIAADVELLRSRAGIDVRLTPVEPAAEAPAPGSRYRLVASALDQPGLVHEVAEVLRRHDANVETLETALEAAPITGAPTFAMDIVVSVPPGAAVDELERDLAAACDLLNVDWTFAPVETAAGHSV